MNAKDKATVKDAISQILNLNGLTNSQKRQIEGLKTVIVKIIDANPADFEQGVYQVEGVGQLKQAANAPKLVATKTGEAPGDTEVIGLLQFIGQDFGKPALNVAKIRDAVKAGNKTLIAGLKKAGVQLVEETRWDVKKLS